MPSDVKKTEACDHPDDHICKVCIEAAGWRVEDYVAAVSHHEIFETKSLFHFLHAK